MGKTILTVDDSASIRQMVSFTLKGAGYDVHLNLQDDETADVSLIQLICAAQREGMFSGKKLTLYKPGEVVGELLSNAGYCKQLNCPEETKATCLWAKTQLSC